jgi:hypothetical protein
VILSNGNKILDSITIAEILEQVQETAKADRYYYPHDHRMQVLAMFGKTICTVPLNESTEKFKIL